MIQYKQKQYSSEDIKSWIGILSGFSVQCKNLHWAAPKHSIHAYLDELHEVIGKYQDSIAEDIMGIQGKFKPLEITYVSCNSVSAEDFIGSLIKEATIFYNNLPENVEFKGIFSETENFIHNCMKYKYLFSL